MNIGIKRWNVIISNISGLVLACRLPHQQLISTSTLVIHLSAFAKAKAKADEVSVTDIRIFSYPAFTAYSHSLEKRETFWEIFSVPRKSLRVLGKNVYKMKKNQINYGSKKHGCYYKSCLLSLRCLSNKISYTDNDKYRYKPDGQCN